MRRVASLDTEALEPGEAIALRRLVEEADLAHAGEPTISSAADRFRYTLTVEDETSKHMLTCSEDRIPPGVGPLIDRLWREAEKEGGAPGGIETA